MKDYNPFNPNTIVPPRLFAGRIKQVNTICQKLKQLERGGNVNFFVFGERGIGKTALAKLILHISTLQDPELCNLNLVTSYYSVSRSQTIDSVLQESLNRLTDSIDRNVIEKLTSSLGNLFKDGKFQIGAFGVKASIDTTDSKTAQERRITIKDQMVSILSKIINSLNQQIDDKKSDGILMVIDEIHNLDNIEEVAPILRGIVTSLNVYGIAQISFLLIGYEEDIAPFFSKDSSSKRIFDFINLEVMPDIEAKEVLTKGFKEVGVEWNEQALESKIELAGGYPHSIQMVGHCLIKGDVDNKIEEGDWENAIFEAAFQLKSKDFSKMYSFDKPLLQRDKVSILLSKESPLSKKEIATRLPDDNVYQCIKELKRRGTIKETASGKIILQSSLLKTAILIDRFIRWSQKDKREALK